MWKIPSFFCTHEIEYLGYILTRGGIKPQPKKVQAILALNPPNNVKELRQSGVYNSIKETPNSIETTGSSSHLDAPKPVPTIGR